MDRQVECPFCGKRRRNVRGLSNHINRCRVQLGEELRKIPLEVQSHKDSTGQILIYDSQFYCPKVAARTDEDSGRDNKPNNTSDDYEVGDVHGSSPIVRKGLLSTSSSTVWVTYQEETNRPAGEPVVDPSEESSIPQGSNSELRQQEPNRQPLYPFQTETDYAWAFWLWHERCSMGAVQRFFDDDKMKSIHDLLSFKNAKEWKSLIQKIPYGIQNDVWTQAVLTIASQTDGVREHENHYIIYRDIVQGIRFLLGHVPFRDKLSYTPVRTYSSQGVRRYSGLHTTEWWWETQSALPEGATVVPLLLSSDKTDLSTHHGDHVAWPIYFTIGNLDAATRRSQTRPGMLLLGFIPTLGKGENEDDLKPKLYHTAMRRALKRKPSVTE